MRTFTLGAGADVVKFTSASSANANTITKFTVAGDKLEFYGTGSTWTGYNSTSAEVVTINSNTNAELNKVYVTTDVANIKATTSFKSKTIIAIDSDDGNIYAVTIGASTGAAPSQSDLIGSIDNWTGLTAENFVFS